MADFGAGAVFGGINTTFRFAEFVIALKEVGSENNVFVRTIQRVRLDLEETERLLSLPAIKLVLANSPEKLEWMKTAIHSTKSALNDIGLYVERVRADKDRDGEVTFAHRVRWVLRDHDKLENRRSELAACHQTLTTVLNTLHPLEIMAGFTAIPTAPTPPMNDPPPPAYEPSLDPDFRSPYQRKKRRPKVEIVETTESVVSNEDPVTDKAPPTEPHLEQKQKTFEYQSAVTLDQVKIGFQQETEQRQFEALDGGPTPQPPARIPSPTPSLAPSCMTSYSSNNFGPINPWDNWNDASTEEIRMDATSISPPLAHVTHRMSISSSISAFSEIAQSPPQLPSKIQVQHETYGAPGPEGYFSPRDTQHQTRSWVSAREPSASIFPLAEMDNMHISELPAESHLPTPRSLDQNFGLPAELGGGMPARKPVASQYTAWNPATAGAQGSDSMAKFSQPQAQNSTMPNYRRAYSSPSDMLHPTAPIPYPSQAVELPPAPTQSAYHPYRPRAQTDMHQNQTQNQTQYLHHSLRTMSSPAAGYYPPLRNTASPAPSFVSSMSQGEDFSPKNLQPEPAAQACGIGRGPVSQSRRRRAMMEAALGVSED